MTNIKVTMAATHPQVELFGTLTSGMVGVPVEFSFGPEWDGLSRTAVFEAGGVAKDRELIGTNETTVPYEVLTVPGKNLKIGVEGRKPDGTLVYPSVFESVGYIRKGANATDDLGRDPSPTRYDDIMRAIGNMDSLKTEARESLVAAINELYRKGGGGSVDPAEIERLVEEYLAENPPPPGKDGAPGADGKPGADGYTPQKGKDYYTETDKQEMVNLVLAAMPTWEGGSY